MNKVTKNKIAMYKAVRDVLAQHSTVWSGTPAFVTVHDSFINKLSALEQSAYNQSLALAGVSAAKDALRQTVIDKTYAISSGIVAFAVLNNNAALIDQANVARYELMNASKANLMIMIDRVIAKATEFGNEIVEFGISEESVTELQTLRDELELMLNSPRNAIIARKGYTRMIKTLREEISTMLNLQLDKLMEVLKEEHPDFFSAYKDARVIVDLRRGKRSDEDDTSNTLGYEE